MRGALRPLKPAPIDRFLALPRTRSWSSQPAGCALAEVGLPLCPRSLRGAGDAMRAVGRLVAARPAVQPRASIAKTAPLLPAHRPGEMEADDDVALTALDRDVVDPARPPRDMAAHTRDPMPTHAAGRQPAPPMPVPASDLGLKLALAGLIALTVVLLVALAVGIATSSSDAEEESGDEAPSRDWRRPRD